MRTAYLIEQSTGYDLSMLHVGTILLDLDGYATMTGRSREDVRAEFGTAWYVPVGGVECNVDAKSPHKGTVDLGFGAKHQWVKAKTYAHCQFQHTGPGESPPYLDWVLRMLLVRDPVPWKWWGAYASYTKRGFVVTFRENQGRRGGTQVWFTYCKNDDYENRVGVWPDPPFPWIYVGIGPVGSESHFGTVTDC